MQSADLHPVLLWAVLKTRLPPGAHHALACDFSLFRDSIAFALIRQFGLTYPRPRSLHRRMYCPDLLLNQPPCALRSRTPYLLGFAYGQPPFSGLATEQRLAPRYLPRPSARRCCGEVLFPSRKVSMFYRQNKVNRDFLFLFDRENIF